MSVGRCPQCKEYFALAYHLHCPKCGLRLEEQAQRKPSRYASEGKAPSGDSLKLYGTVFVILLILFGCGGFWNMLQDERRESDRRYEAQQEKEKADELRRYGYHGSDSQLSQTHDDIERFNELQRQRRSP